MVFSRMLHKARAMERDCREGTNEANFLGRIRFIRQIVLKEIRTLRKPCHLSYSCSTCAGKPLELLRRAALGPEVFKIMRHFVKKIWSARANQILSSLIV